MPSQASRRSAFCGLLKRKKQDARITDEVLVKKARKPGKDFPHLNVPKSFAVSCGWIYNFKKRHDIPSMLLHGDANAADMSGVARACKTLAKLVTKFSHDNGSFINFAPTNIFNQDETGLFWRQQPACTLATGWRAGTKKAMERARLGLAYNATGYRETRPSCH